MILLLLICRGIITRTCLAFVRSCSFDLEAIVEADPCPAPAPAPAQYQHQRSMNASFVETDIVLGGDTLVVAVAAVVVAAVVVAAVVVAAEVDLPDVEETAEIV